MNELKARHADLLLESPLDVPRFLSEVIVLLVHVRMRWKHFGTRLKFRARARARTSERIRNDKYEGTPTSALMNKRNRE